MKKLKIAYIPYDGKEVNNIAFSEQFDNRWTNILKNKLEKEGHSIATYDINKISESDVILSFDNVYFQNFRHFKKILKHKKLGQTIHIDYEPPSANCQIHNKSGLKRLSTIFKSLITYNDDVINGKTRIKGNIADYLESEKKFKNDFSKRKLIAIIANYRYDLLLFKPHKNELYSKRKEAVLFFQERIPKDFDLYGSYWPKEAMICNKGALDRDKKMDTISKYKFILSYDSIKNQNGYISEKIFDIFKAKSIPIYWGASNISDYIPEKCYIDRRDFKTYEELYQYISKMTEKEYNDRIRAIEKYLKSKKYTTMFSSEASAEVIYNEIMKPERKINYFWATIMIGYYDWKRKSNIIYNFDNNYVETESEFKILKHKVVKLNDSHKIQLIYEADEKDQVVFFVKNKNEYKNLNEIDMVSKPNGKLHYKIYIDYDELFLDGKQEFFVKLNNQKHKLKIDTDLEINKLSYDLNHKVVAHNNVIKIVNKHNLFKRLVRRIKSLLKRGEYNEKS